MSFTPTKEETITAVHEVAAAVDAGVDYFTLLRVPFGADPAQIRDAYFRLVRLVHPASMWIIGNPDLARPATRAFNAVMTAHSALADAGRRQAYMASLTEQIHASRVGDVTHSGQPAPVPLEGSLPELPPSPPRPALSTAPRAATTSSSRPPLVPGRPPWRAPTPEAMQGLPLVAPRGPTDAISAVGQVAAARTQLALREWSIAQETLERALPFLTEPVAIAECKVLLGFAIYSNQTNFEPFRLTRSKQLWDEVATRHAYTPPHAQAAYHLAVWHKLHGDSRLVCANLQTCLDLQPLHNEAARELRLLALAHDAPSERNRPDTTVPTLTDRRGPDGGRRPPPGNTDTPAWLLAIIRLFRGHD